MTPNRPAATPRPWAAKGAFIEGSKDGVRGRILTATAYWMENAPEIAAANAALIVRAVNAHDELVAVLYEAGLQIEYLHEKFSKTGMGNACLKKIEAALAKASQP